MIPQIIAVNNLRLWTFLYFNSTCILHDRKSINNLIWRNSLFSRAIKYAWIANIKSCIIDFPNIPYLRFGKLFVENLIKPCSRFMKIDFPLLNRAFTCIFHEIPDIIRIDPVIFAYVQSDNIIIIRHFAKNALVKYVASIRFIMSHPRGRCYQNGGNASPLFFFSSSRA